MCDYSLQNVKTRDAALHDVLVTTSFGTGTRGFACPDDSTCAVCVRPGTEIAFDKPIQTLGAEPTEFKVAIFRQINKDQPHMHHDCLELPDGNTILLTYLAPEQTAKIIQLPVAPRTAAEEQEQTRVEYAG
jgi:hypothetical protein